MASLRLSLRSDWKKAAAGFWGHHLPPTLLPLLHSPHSTAPHSSVQAPWTLEVEEGGRSLCQPEGLPSRERPQPSPGCLLSSTAASGDRPRETQVPWDASPLQCTGAQRMSLGNRVGEALPGPEKPLVPTREQGMK